MRINLVPPEIRQRQLARRRSALVAALGIVVLALLGAFFVLQQIRLGGLRNDLANQEAVNETFRARVAELQQFRQLEEELVATQALLDQVLADEVRWSGVLRDISLVIPGQTWLTTLDGTIGLEAAEAEPGAPAAVSRIVGQITFSGNGLSHRAAALWLTRLEDVDGFVNPWLSNSQRIEIGEADAVEFSSSVDLSDRALVRRPGGPQ